MRRLNNASLRGTGRGIEFALLVTGLALAIAACAVSMSLGAPRLLTGTLAAEHIEVTADAAAACTSGAAILVLASMLIGTVGRRKT
jgi:hypothetical protein